MQGGDLQQGFMIDVGDVEEERRGRRGTALEIAVGEKLSEALQHSMQSTRVLMQGS